MKLDNTKSVSLHSIINSIEDKAMACQTYHLMIEDDKKKKGKVDSKLIYEFDNLYKSKQEYKQHLINLIEWWLDEAYNNGLTAGRRSK